MKMRFKLLTIAVVAAGIAFALPTIVAAGDWGNIKGRVVWGGDKLPDNPQLDVSKDAEHCLGAGPIKDETFVVNPKTKGVRHVFVYLRFKGKPVIHPDFPQSTADVEAADKAAFEKMNGFKIEQVGAKIAEGKVQVKDLKAAVVMDQLRCTYVPHALAMREGQKILVLNKEPITHNVKVSSQSGKNDANPNLPPNSYQFFSWVEEKSTIKVECSIHGWMRMNAMCFEHPYFNVTDENGAFELKNVPAGELEIVIRHPPGSFVDAVKGGKGSARGAKIKVEANGTLDLGDIKFTNE